MRTAIGPKSRYTCPIPLSNLFIFSPRSRFLRGLFFTCFDNLVRLLVRFANLRHRCLQTSCPINFNKRLKNVFERLLANKPLLYRPSSHDLTWIIKSAESSPYEWPRPTTQGSMASVRSAASRRKAMQIIKQKQAAPLSFHDLTCSVLPCVISRGRSYGLHLTASIIEWNEDGQSNSSSFFNKRSLRYRGAYLLRACVVFNVSLLLASLQYILELLLFC
jgi:hypothetical protein